MQGTQHSTNYFRRNSTLLVPKNLNRKKSLSLNILPRQNEKFLCVPDYHSPQIRHSQSTEYIYFDPKLPSLKKIESYTSLVIPSDFKFAEVEVQLYRIRWVFLSLYVIFTALSFMQWIQFSIITNLIMKFYGVSSVAVDWTSMVFMVTYILFVFPVSYLIEERSLREISIIGSTGTAVGSWIKTFAIKSSGFPILLLGQIVVSIAQIFIIGLPGKLASAWFSADEMSTVSGLAVFSVQLGIALGFVVTPWLAKVHGTNEDIRLGLEVICFLNAGLTTIVSCFVIAVFKSKPEIPPSHVQAIVRSTKITNTGYWKSINQLMHDAGFLMVISSYGINTGVLSALSTLLNQIILNYFPNSEQDAGNVGVAIIVMGLFGSIVFGFVMDTMHKFQPTALWVSGCSAIGMFIFFLALASKSKILLYVASISLGFFMTGYQTVGLELAAELVYPTPDGPVNGMMNISTHLFGILFTSVLSRIGEIFGQIFQHITFILLLSISTGIISRISSTLKRTFVQKEVADTIQELAEIEKDGSQMLLKVEEC